MSHKQSLTDQYRKWDNFDVSSSEEDSDDDGEQPIPAVLLAKTESCAVNGNQFHNLNAKIQDFLRVSKTNKPIFNRVMDRDLNKPHVLHIEDVDGLGKFALTVTIGFIKTSMASKAKETKHGTETTVARAWHYTAKYDWVPVS